MWEAIQETFHLLLMKFSFFSFLFSPLGIDIILTDFLFLHWNWACPTFHNISHIKLWKGSFFIDKTNDLIHERDIISNTFFFYMQEKNITWVIAFAWLIIFASDCYFTWYNKQTFKEIKVFFSFFYDITVLNMIIKVVFIDSILYIWRE